MKCAVRCYVYVIEIPSRGILYVGSTCKTVKERVAEHRAKFGDARARHDLFSKSPFKTRQQAEEFEAALAKTLRLLGHKVRQG